jgi:DnaJ-class molecular chaperone
MIPEGKVICPDCKGMGIVGRASNESLNPRGPTIAGNTATNLPNKTTCSLCLGSGVAAKPVKK